MNKFEVFSVYPKLCSFNRNVNANVLTAKQISAPTSVDRPAGVMDVNLPADLCKRGGGGVVRAGVRPH